MPQEELQSPESVPPFRPDQLQRIHTFGGIYANTIHRLLYRQSLADNRNARDIELPHAKELIEQRKNADETDVVTSTLVVGMAGAESCRPYLADEYALYEVEGVVLKRIMEELETALTRCHYEKPTAWLLERSLPIFRIGLRTGITIEILLHGKDKPKIARNRHSIVEAEQRQAEKDILPLLRAMLLDVLPPAAPIEQKSTRWARFKSLFRRRPQGD